MTKKQQNSGVIPEIKTRYWYLRSNFYPPYGFIIVESEWNGSISDLHRLAKGNVYLDYKDAVNCSNILNSRFRELSQKIVNARQRERLAEEAARKKAEALERKRLRDEEKKKLTQADKARQYENNKKKKQKKSPHPDIII